MARRTEKKPKATVVEPPPEGAKLWTVGQVAFALGGLSVSTVQRLAKDPASDFPKPLVIGLQQHRWLAEAVEAYIERRAAEAA